MTELKNRIQSAMDYAKINGKELSVITGLTTAAISQYKTGKILTLNAMAAQKIADALGVNVEWLVTGEGNMIKPNIISLDNADSDSFLQASFKFLNIRFALVLVKLKNQHTKKSKIAYQPILDLHSFQIEV